MNDGVRMPDRGKGLSVHNIEVKYNNVILVLRGVSLEVKDGSIVALLGNNGAGKSTLLKAISGLLKIELGKVTSGNIEFDGRRIENGSPEQTTRMGIFQVLEGRGIFEHVTVEENLKAGACHRRDVSQVKRDFEMVYEYFPRLKDLRHRTAGYISGGEQQMMVIGRAMLGAPKLMMLDEPSLGLAPMTVHGMFDVIKRFNKERKISILLVEQNVKVALSVADYGYVMENGKIVFDGEAEKLINNPDIKEFYLGLSKEGRGKTYKDVKHYRRRKRWLG